MAIDRSRKIGLYPNRDYKTKEMKPGLRSVKLTEENKAAILAMPVGSSIMILPNTYKKDDSHPSDYIILPAPQSSDF